MHQLVFTLDFLQAVNDWQRDRNDDKKSERGARLKELSREIDARYRQCDAVVYRRVALKKRSIWQLIAEEKLPEAISSWTLAPELAKNFKGGVPSQSWQGVLFAVKPHNESVIVNLHALYESDEFKTTLERMRDFVDGYEDGAGLYAGSESEVVLEIESLNTNSIQALGGYSSSKNELIHAMFGEKPTQDQIAWFEESLNKAGFSPGAQWLEGELLQRVLGKMGPHIDRLKQIKDAQHAPAQISK